MLVWFASAEPSVHLSFFQREHRDSGAYQKQNVELRVAGTLSVAHVASGSELKPHVAPSPSRRGTSYSCRFHFLHWCTDRRSSTAGARARRAHVRAGAWPRGCIHCCRRIGPRNSPRICRSSACLNYSRPVLTCAWIDMCAYVCVDMVQICVQTCIDIYKDVCRNACRDVWTAVHRILTDMLIDMCIDGCPGMCPQTCTDMHVDVCTDICT